MFNAQRPSLDELPSSAQLLRSTMTALIVALVLLVTVVMPAEYAIDPTGAGRLLELTPMGELKAALTAEADAERAQPGVAPAVVVPAAQPQPEALTAAVQRHEVNLTLKPNEAAEIKLEMKKGAHVNYLWSANGGELYYDAHGDPYNAPKDFYHGYGKGQQTPELQGVLVAAFDGKHGWYWRNRSEQTVQLTLRTMGDYITIEQML